MQKEIQNKKIKNNAACPQCFRYSGSRRGFSLIEVIISVFLITVGLIASVELLTKGLRESMDSRDQLIAVGLVQEGIELVRNVRDNNWLQTGLSDPNFQYLPDDDYRIDKDFAYGQEISNSTAYRLYIKNGFYVHDASNSTPTKFQRKVLIEEPNAETRRIISIVTWGNLAPPDSSDLENTCKTSNKCTYAETILSKWGEGVF